MNALRLFFRRTTRERALFLEALLLLLRAKVMVRWVPFRRIAPGLGRRQAETPVTITAEERAVVVEVSWAVQAAARHVPLRFVCLPQAITAQRMLRRRGVGSTLYFGVALDGGGDDAIALHAWLRAGDRIVTGEAEMRTHRAMAWFADFPAPR